VLPVAVRPQKKACVPKIFIGLLEIFYIFYRIFQEKVPLFDVDISTQINTLDGMPKTC